MLSSRSRAIARTGALILSRDPAPHVVMVVLPLLFTAFLKPAMAAQLAATGHPGANGSEQLIPGMAVMFCFLSSQAICMLFFREHYWGTWDRLRATGARASELLVGKAAPLLVLMAAQMTLLFATGALVFGFRITGSVVALVALVTGVVLLVLTFGLMTVAVFRTLDQAMVVGSLVGMLMAGLGGALAPVSSLPSWAQGLAHAMPTYWGMNGLSDVTLRGAGLADVAGPLAVLFGSAAACAVVAAWRFRPSEAKNGLT